MEDYQIDSEVIATWWSAATEAMNHQMRHLLDNNSEESLKETLKAFIENGLEEHGMPEHVDIDEFKDTALEQIMEDPYTMVFGKILSGFVAEFMRMCANNDFRVIAGTKLTISRLRNEEGVVCGCEIGRVNVDDSEISEIANNGLADLEAFLNRVTPGSEDN